MIVAVYSDNNYVYDNCGLECFSITSHVRTQSNLRLIFDDRSLILLRQKIQCQINLLDDFFRRCWNRFKWCLKVNIHTASEFEATVKPKLFRYACLNDNFVSNFDDSMLTSYNHMQSCSDI